MKKRSQSKATMLHPIHKLILCVAIILLTGYLVTLLCELIPRNITISGACPDPQERAVSLSGASYAPVGCIPAADYTYNFHGFPISSQFCGIYKEHNCTYPNDEYREPLYILGETMNNYSRFQLNYAFWVFITASAMTTVVAAKKYKNRGKL